MQAHSVLSHGFESNTRYVDNKPVYEPGDLNMSESLCFKDFSREHLVFGIISRCSHFYSSVVFVLYRRTTEKECKERHIYINFYSINQISQKLKDILETKNVIWTTDQREIYMTHSTEYIPLVDDRLHFFLELIAFHISVPPSKKRSYLHERWLGHHQKNLWTEYVSIQICTAQITKHFKRLGQHACMLLCVNYSFLVSNL